MRQFTGAGFILALAALWTAGCGVPEAEGAGRDAHAEHAAMASGSEETAHSDPRAHREMAAADPSEHSIYLMPGSWTDQHGDPTTLAGLAGRPQVVAMAYTYCSFACPAIIARMKQIEAELEAEGLTGAVGFTLVSIDPERDTPERLSHFAESSGLDPARWTLLNGSDRDVRTLSVLLGVKIQALDDGEFAHSNVLTVLDPEGVIVGRVEGLGSDLAPAIRTLRDLVR